MEPLDPKAELMRLANDWKRAPDFAIDLRNKLSAAITQALADARRLALEEAANVCETRPESEQSPSWAKASVACAYCIRALIDGKTT